MKKLLLATTAAAAFVAMPAMAQNHNGAPLDVEVDASVDIEYSNNIDTSLTTDATFVKLVGILGGAFVTGEIAVDSAAVAITDAKQLLQGVAVTYREENELNGENGYVDPVFGPGWSEAGNDPNDGLIDGVLEPQIRAGYFAPVINTVDSFAIDSSGNTGINLAAGYFNMQMNSATLATSSNASDDAVGGWSEASTTAFQSQLGVSQQGTPGFTSPGDDPELGGDNNNFRDRNSVLGGTIAGSGNIGVNAAAGSLNQQANLMTLAVANDTTLAEANAGLIQTSTLSFVEQQDSQNLVTGLVIDGTSGNVGVNFASGVGNQQLNALTIASSAGGAPANGGGTGGGDPD
ncbi:hypothetical protein [Erythrobacter sanguineus]|jgi:hypothetical protein|uniref:Uncharacterized protein n=1 Tax=Erythrobacter sanguineus TaxID=198312 RepID=A0A1M7S1Q6_9SPHN|nr:hypothetical protein [Erythrobacter sanguineus]MCR9180467.1 hypothetical protein [Erythrobacteraceae bacterium]SHN52391.1 hypothetical protein SAMN02745193_00769 [Erythrobacter sanguineus]